MTIDSSHYNIDSSYYKEEDYSTTYKHLKELDTTKVFDAAHPQIKAQIDQINKDTKRGYQILLDGTKYTNGTKLFEALTKKGISPKNILKILSQSHQGFFKLKQEQEMGYIQTSSGIEDPKWMDPHNLKRNAPKISISTENENVVISSQITSILGRVDIDQIPDEDDLSKSSFIKEAEFTVSTKIDLTKEKVSVLHRLITPEQTEQTSALTLKIPSPSFSSPKAETPSPTSSISKAETPSPASSPEPETSSPTTSSPKSGETSSPTSSPTQGRIEPYFNLKDPGTVEKVSKLIRRLR